MMSARFWAIDPNSAARARTSSGVVPGREHHGPAAVLDLRDAFDQFALIHVVATVVLLVRADVHHQNRAVGQFVEQFDDVLGVGREHRGCVNRVRRPLAGFGGEVSV